MLACPIGWCSLPFSFWDCDPLH